MLFKILNKTFWLSLALSAVFLLSLSGCAANKEAPPAATSAATAAPLPSSQEVMEGAHSSLAKLTSYQYQVNMSVKMAGSVKNQPQNTNLTVSGEGVSDITNQKTQVNLNMEMESPNQGKISLPMELYSVDGWQYVKTSVPFSGSQWIKTKMDMKSLAAADQTQQALQILKTAVKVTVTGSETVDGTPCYVLEVNPDPTVLAEWTKSMQSTTNMSGAMPADMDPGKFIKNLSVKVYLTQDSYLLKKSEIAATLALSGTDLGSGSQPGDSLTVDIFQTVKMTQSNQPVNITLPPEAQTAREMSGEK